MSIELRRTITRYFAHNVIIVVFLGLNSNLVKSAYFIYSTSESYADLNCVQPHIEKKNLEFYDLFHSCQLAMFLHRCHSNGDFVFFHQTKIITDD